MTRTCCTKQCVNDSFSEQALSNASTIDDLSSIVFEISTCHPWCALNKLRHELTYGEFFNHFDLPRTLQLVVLTLLYIVLVKMCLSALSRHIHTTHTRTRTHTPRARTHRYDLPWGAMLIVMTHSVFSQGPPKTFM